MLHQLLASLPTLHPCPCHIGIVAFVVLVSLIAKESATAATMPVQQGRWHGCNYSKDASNRGNPMCPGKRPCCTGIVTIRALVSFIAEESARTATMPVQQGHWCNRNDGKDASYRGNMTCSNQLVQQKDKRLDKRSGAEDAMQGNLVADNTTRGGADKVRGVPCGGLPPLQITYKLVYPNSYTIQIGIYKLLQNIMQICIK